MPADFDQRQRLALLLSFNGMTFEGSQTQLYHGTVKPTIQSALEQAFDQLHVYRFGAITLCSRTDAGVHAQGMVAHVDVDPDSLKNIDCLRLALNAVLPGTIRIKHWQVADVKFHCRHHAQYRWYRYQVYAALTTSPLLPANVLWFPYDIRLDVLQQEAQALLGTHDFKAFQNANSAIRETECTLKTVQVSLKQGEITSAPWDDGPAQTSPNTQPTALPLAQPPEKWITIDFVADRYLYKMVRNMVGHLLALSRQDFPQQAVRRRKASNAGGVLSITDVLHSQNRQNVAATAPAAGLTLMAALYPSPWNYFQEDPFVQYLHTTLENGA